MGVRGDVGGVSKMEGENGEEHRNFGEGQVLLPAGDSVGVSGKAAENVKISFGLARRRSESDEDVWL